MKLDSQNILSVANRVATQGLDKLEQSALPAVVDKVAEELKASPADLVAIRAVIVEAWTAANDAAGLKARGAIAQGDAGVGLGAMRASAGALGSRFPSPLAKAEARSVDDIKAFVPHYASTVESYAKTTTQQMFDKFNGFGGLPADVRQSASSLMKEVVAQTAELFGPGGFNPPDDPALARAAANQHAGYVAGEITRKFAYIKPEWILPHFEAILAGQNPSIESLANALASQVRPDDKQDIKDFVLNPDNGWMFGAYGFGKSDIALNLPGVFAGKATIDFACDLAGSELAGVELAQKTLSLLPWVVETGLRGPEGIAQKREAALSAIAHAEKLGDEPLLKKAESELRIADEASQLSTEQLALLQFAARAAQAGWLTSKLGQGIVEAHHSNPAKAEKGVSRFGPKNELITDFDALAAKKGWSEVAKDVDQVKNAVTAQTLAIPAA